MSPIKKLIRWWRSWRGKYQNKKVIVEHVQIEKDKFAVVIEISGGMSALPLESAYELRNRLNASIKEIEWQLFLQDRIDLALNLKLDLK